MAKYLFLVPDGAADEPQEALGGLTPLQAAETPHFDALARKGEVGLAHTVPEGLEAQSDVANMSLLGYDPLKYYSGRGPLEALAQGVDLGPKDVAFRCNLISCDGEKLVSFSGGHVTTEEARELMTYLDDKLGTRQLKFFPGISYRNLLVWREGPVDSKTFAPHDHVGEPLESILPQGDGAERLAQLIWDSYELLDAHPINRRRRDEGKLAANAAWPWSAGRLPKVTPLTLRFGLRGAVVCAVDLIKGLGKLAGLVPLAVEGATGYLDTNYEGKGKRAVEAFEDFDFVYVHVEAPDEASHDGSLEAKLEALQKVDELVLGQILEAGIPELSIVVAPDHPTPLRLKTHLAAPVPFVVCKAGATPGKYSADEFSEPAAEATGLVLEKGHELITRLCAD